MYSQLSEEDIEFMEALHRPDAVIECLMPENHKAPHLWENEDCKLVRLRNYQFAMLNYSYLFADDDRLTDQENFSIKERAGKIINIAARDIGKSFLLIFDCLTNIIHGEGDEACVASFDFKHLKKISKPIGNFAKYHPFFKIFFKNKKPNVTFSDGGMEISTATGHVTYGKNENIQAGDDAGTDFHSLHVKWLGYEEASYMSDAGTEKRIDARDSLGCIERLSGIPDLRIGSPLGRILKEEGNKTYICRIPQYVKESWSERTKKEKARDYGGVNSIAYKLNVEGTLLEGAYGKFQMDRIRKNCLMPKKKIKFFEIGKKNFSNFKNELPVIKQASDFTIIASDIGSTGSPSEIIICFKRRKIWRYEYQISLFKLTFDEQAEIFKYLYDILGNAVISIDCSEAGGRDIRKQLMNLGVPSSDLCDFDFKSNLEIDFKKDDKGKPMTDTNGNWLMEKEKAKPFGIQYLEKLLYNGLIKVPYQEKFLSQFADFIEKKTETGNVKYGTTSEDHLVDSFIFFALAVWKYEDDNVRNMQPRKRRTLACFDDD